MVVNPDKFQLMFVRLTENHKLCLNIGGKKISSTDNVKLIGIEIDNKLTISNHVKTFCDKTNKNSVLLDGWETISQ